MSKANHFDLSAVQTKGEEANIARAKSKMNLTNNVGEMQSSEGSLKEFNET